MSEAAAGATPAAGPGISRILPDRRLVERAKRGDSRAFATIYERHGQALYRYCMAILGDPQDAQDALQATMEKALSALPGEERKIELKPWLYRIAHNESIDLIRRRRGDAELDPETIVDGPGLAAETETRERLRRLLADLGQLPERQRGALVMRELAGLDFDQIATALGTSSAVARQTLYEARLGLRQAEEGREMDCAEVTRALSDGDGRVLRRRDIRAHLRSCDSCRAFRKEIGGRSHDLAAITPLPALALSGIIGGLFGGGGSGGAAGLGVGSAVGGGAAKAIGTGAALKATAAVAVVAAVGTVAADRGSLIDTPLPGGDAGKASREAPAASAANGAASGVAGVRQGERTDAARRARAGIRERARAGAVGGTVGVAGTGNPGFPAGDGAPGNGLARGREGDLPEAASHGQQTAAAHKQAGKAKGHGGGVGGGRSKGKSEGRGQVEPAAKTEHPAHPEHPSKPPTAATPEKSAGGTVEPSGSAKSKAADEAGPQASEPGSGSTRTAE